MYEITTDTAAMAWSPSNWPGMSMKLLQHGGAGGGATSLIRMEPGSAIPAHKHTTAGQSVFVIEGDLIDDDVVYGPGTFLVAKAGTPHGPHGTKDGCVLLTVYAGPPDFVTVT